MKRLLLAFGIGLSLAGVGIGLLNHYPTHEAAVQVAVWSLIVLAIVIGPNYEQFREGSFWKAMVVVALLHVICLTSFWRSLPFSTLGVAILVSTAEGIGLGIVFVAISSGFRKQSNG